MNVRGDRVTSDAGAAGFEALERHVRDRGAWEFRPDAAAMDRVRRVVAEAFDTDVAARARPVVAGTPTWRHVVPMPGPDPGEPRSIAGWRTAPGHAAGGRSVLRRGMLIAACAAMLAVASVAGPAWVFASESVPGHALYSVRIAAESIGLQPLGTPERAASEAHRLRVRVQELREEVGRGDWGGAAAALAAAQAQTAQVERALTAAPAARPAVRQALAGTRGDLEALERERALPGEIRTGERALERELHRGILGADTQ